MSWLKAKDWATGVEYSTLFHSGLRTISLRPRDRRTRTSSSSPSWEKSSNGGTPSLSSRLLRRKSTRTRHPSPSVSLSTESSPGRPSRPPKVQSPRPSSMFVRPTKEMEAAWSSGERFFEVEDCPKFVDEEHLRTGYLLPPIELDAVRSLAGTCPLFVNLAEMDGLGEDPFLLLTNSSDGFLRHPIPRREGPVSMQPTPLPSRRSSMHRRTREKGDCAWTLEDSSPELKAYDPGDEEDAERDWRQFHVDWVRNIC